ncbi:hypothetical protein BGX28_010388 [Mortierella sp. GBA30]|nr:hypothetical protein BGX28_010388 [Mortierella sp. GBA30]
MSDTTDDTTNPVIPRGSSTFRFPHPQTYDGARDGFQCEAWLTSAKCFFRGARIPTDDQTLHAIVFLTGSASLWWEGNSLTDAATWDEFEAAFHAEFISAGFVDHIRSLLFTMKLTSTLAEYIGRIRQYRGILVTPAMGDEGKAVLDDTIKTSFRQGIPKSVNQMLLSYE